MWLISLVYSVGRGRSGISKTVSYTFVCMPPQVKRRSDFPILQPIVLTTFRGFWVWGKKCQNINKKNVNYRVVNFLAGNWSENEDALTATIYENTLGIRYSFSRPQKPEIDTWTRGYGILITTLLSADFRNAECTGYAVRLD